MSEGVTYADLRFARAPLENSPQPLREGSGDGDLTYENVHAAKPRGEEKASHGSKQHKGPRKPFWPITWALLGASLFLLATSVGFGVQYRQVSRHLREALAASAAESRSLVGALDARERGLLELQSRLEQAEAELNWSWTALLESRQLVNSTRGWLQEKEAELAAAIQERREAEGALNATLSEACAGWCPEEWLLYSGRCLFFSTQTKTWMESKRDCEEEKAALLLITQAGVPPAILGSLGFGVYWNGRYGRWSTEGTKRVCVWLESSQDTGKAQGRRTGSSTPPTSTDVTCNSCETLQKGRWATVPCKQKNRYICEKPARRPRGPAPLPVGSA